MNIRWTRTGYNLAVPSLTATVSPTAVQPAASQQPTHGRPTFSTPPTHVKSVGLSMDLTAKTRIIFKN